MRGLREVVRCLIYAIRAVDRGIQIVNLIAFFEWSVPEDEERAKGLEEARRCFEMADALNCTYVAAPPFGIRDRDVDLFSVARHYGELMDEVAGFRARALAGVLGYCTDSGYAGRGFAGGG